MIAVLLFCPLILLLLLLVCGGAIQKGAFYIYTYELLVVLIDFIFYCGESERAWELLHTGTVQVYVQYDNEDRNQDFCKSGNPAIQQLIDDRDDKISNTYMIL